MDTTLLASIIAGFGVIISAIISFIIAERTAKHQIIKIRYEIQHNKAEKLTEKRIEVYSMLYSIISRLNRLIQEEKLSKEEFKIIYVDMNDWYQQNGLFLGSKSNREVWECMKQLRKFIKGGNQVIAGSLGINEQRRKFIGHLNTMELELKKRDWYI